MTRRSPRRRGSGLPVSIRTERERREHLIAIGLVAVLQLAIALSLVVSAAQTYRMWRKDVPYLPPEVRRVVPLVLLAGAAVASMAGLRTVGRIRRLRGIPLEPESTE